MSFAGPSDSKADLLRVLSSEVHMGEEDLVGGDEHDNKIKRDGSSALIKKKYIPNMIGDKQYTWTEVYIILSGLLLGILLSGLDQTIVTVALPYIAEDFNSLDSVSWVGTSFMLTSTACQPLYGRTCDLFGPTWPLIFSLVTFGIFSLGCGAASSMVSLIIFRALSGIGAAGVFSCTTIVISLLIPMDHRALYFGFVSATFGISNVCGPILGGTIVDTISWRWCFYINIPIIAISLFIMLIWGRLPAPKGSTSDRLKQLDYIGIVILVTGVVLILLAFSWGGIDYSWSSPIVLSCLIIGLALSVLFAFHENRTRYPLIAMRLLRIRNVWATALAAFASGVAMFSTFYYEPIYFDAAKGYSGTQSGLHMLPYLMGVTLFSVSLGFIVNYTGEWWIFVLLGAITCTLGMYLQSLLKADSDLGMQILLCFPAGAGIGMVLQPYFLATQVAVAKEDIAVATPISIFTRMVGGTVGMAIFGNVFLNKLKSLMVGVRNDFPDYLDIIDQALEGASIIHDSSSDAVIMPDLLRSRLIDTYVKALSWGFLVITPITAISIPLALSLKRINLKTYLKNPPPELELRKKDFLNVGSMSINSSLELASS